MEIRLPKPWPEFLGEVDRALDEPVNLHCVGGFILVVLYDLPRTTIDLDYISVHPPEAATKLEGIAGERSPLAKKYKVFIHAVGICDFPENYEERLEHLDLKLRWLHLWALEPYDLALSKLGRNSQKDRDDVRFIAGKLGLQFETLYARWEKEMKPFMIGRTEWHDQTLRQVWREYFK